MPGGMLSIQGFHQPKLCVPSGYGRVYPGGRIGEQSAESRDYRRAGDEALAGEFREFERQLREGDHESCRKALENSIAVMEVLEACRRYAGIQFSGDQEISLAGRKRF